MAAGSLSRNLRPSMAQELLSLALAFDTLIMPHETSANFSAAALTWLQTKLHSDRSSPLVLEFQSLLVQNTFMICRIT